MSIKDEVIDLLNKNLENLNLIEAAFNTVNKNHEAELKLRNKYLTDFIPLFMAMFAIGVIIGIIIR